MLKYLSYQRNSSDQVIMMAQKNGLNAHIIAFKPFLMRKMGLEPTRAQCSQDP